MAKSYVQDGAVVDYAITGSAISSGDVVMIGSNGDSVIGVALQDIAATTGVGSVGVEGVFDLPKADAAVIAAGGVFRYLLKTPEELADVLRGISIRSIPAPSFGRKLIIVIGGIGLRS